MAAGARGENRKAGRRRALNMGNRREVLPRASYLTVLRNLYASNSYGRTSVPTAYHYGTLFHEKLARISRFTARPKRPAIRRGAPGWRNFREYDHPAASERA